MDRLGKREDAPLRLSDYARWVSQEVLSPSPESRLKDDWIPNWNRTLTAIRSADGIFELLSIICARWEFLGALYLGSTGDTGGKEVLAYTSHFLVPINSDYRQIHDISGQGGARSEFFTMFRNRVFHGYTPGAVALPGNTNVIAWLIGFNERTQTNHLRVVNGSMHIDGARFLCEFLHSLNDFAGYLHQNNDLINGRLPHARWQRAFWARFRPLYIQEDNWMQEGISRGIPS